MRAAPLACVIDYALNAHITDAPPSPSSLLQDPSALGLAAQRAGQCAAFAVFDWYLERFPELLDAPLQHTHIAGPLFVSVLTPLLCTLNGLTRGRPPNALALLARLLQLGVSLLPPPPGTVYNYSGNGGEWSPLCYVMDSAAHPAGARAVRMLIAAGARLAPGEALTVVVQCLLRVVYFHGTPPEPPAAIALRALLLLYSAALGGGLFESLEDQERTADLWLRHTDAAPEVLDALRLLGLRMDVVRRVALGLAEQSRGNDALRAADAASGERIMRTLLRERLPLEIVSNIAQRANADAPSWQLGLGPMNPPLRSGSTIAAADARASQRRRALDSRAQ